MQDRRESVRDRVLFSGVAEINDRGATMDCVVRNFSDHGACVKFKSTALLPDEIKITRKKRSYLARTIWRQANLVGLAFRTMVTDALENDLDARLRESQRKKRQLQRRINELLGEE